MDTCALKECGKTFIKNKYNQIYCSHTCAKRVDYLKNKDAYKKRAEKHRDKDIVAWRKKSNDYYHSHKEDCLIKMQLRRRDPNRINVVRLQKLKRYKLNIQYKLNHNISNMLRKRLMKRVKTNLHLLNFGYTIDELKIHLEKQFNVGMRWDNYGTFWAIDHRIPCFWFDLKNDFR